jgi:acetyl esterase
MSLDPVVEVLLGQLAEAGGLPLNEMSPSEGRAMYQAMNADAVKQALTEVTDTDAAGVPVRIYRPSAQDNLACIVFYHGGGWVIGDLETHDGPCRRLANATGAVVVAVDYRLAPEHPFPAAQDDCYTATCWVADNAAALNIDASKIAVAGASAGGTLAAVVSLRARDGNGPKIAHQLLIYPATDAAMNTQSYSDNADGYMLTRESMAWFWQNYLGTDYLGTDNQTNPLASPLMAESLANLPPATIITAEFDPLRDEGEAYGEKLKAAGNDAEIVREDGLIHGFISLVDGVPAADKAVTSFSGKLKIALG